MFSIGDLRQLVGENYKDKNECAKSLQPYSLASQFLTGKLETYQELYDDVDRSSHLVLTSKPQRSEPAAAIRSKIS